MNHSSVRSALYEYIRGELAPEEMERVAGHLASCDRCSAEMDSLRSVIGLTSTHVSSASDTRPEEFWNGFAASVERRIELANSPGRRPPLRIREKIMAIFTLRPRPVFLAGGALAAAALAVIFLRIFSGGSPREEISSAAAIEPARAVPADYRMGDYLRKSKVLLVGIAHLDAEDDQPIDLTKESKVSQELLDDARYLKSQPLDIRSAKLIDDLQKILISLANMKEQEGLPNVEMIRSGIHRENLLFKIRMAEAMCDSTRYVPVRDQY
jgi:hypothetical protein